MMMEKVGVLTKTVLMTVMARLANGESMRASAMLSLLQLLTLCVCSLLCRWDDQDNGGLGGSDPDVW